MITVSDSFQKAIKNTTREIRAYVEVLYDIKEKDVQTFEIFDRNLESDVAEITTISQLKNHNRIANKYACFDRDFFKLDGSVVLPSYGENKNAGYISNTISDENGSLLLNENDNGLAIKITSSEKYITKGFSLYFDEDNYPTELQYDNGLENVIVQNNSNYLFIEQEWDFNNGSFWIYITQLSKPQSRVRIVEIDLGISKVYKGNELIDFTFTEEVDKLNIEMPSNELELNVSNYDKNFDYNNPKGIIKFLSSNSKIAPYIGVLTEDEGITYVPCGVFYFCSWKANHDDTATIVARDFFDKMKEVDYTNINHTVRPSQYIMLYLIKWGIEYSWIGRTVESEVSDFYVPAKPKIEKIQLLSSLACGISNSDRNGKFKFFKIPATISDTVVFSNMIKKPSIEEKTRIKKVKVRDYGIYNGDFSKEETLFNGTFEIHGTKTVYINFDNSIWAGSHNNLNVKNGTLIDTNIFTAKDGYIRVSLVSLTLEADGLVEVTLTGIKEFDNATYITFDNRDIGDEITIENRFLYEDQAKTFAPIINQHYLENDDIYKITIEYFGNPAIECGDLLKVETDFGYKKVFVSKHQLKFDGGLTGIVEGTCN